MTNKNSLKKIQAKKKKERVNNEAELDAKSVAAAAEGRSAPAEVATTTLAEFNEDEDIIFR